MRDDHRLGDVNNGWNVALTTLMNERAAIGAGGGGGGGINMYTRVIEMVRHFGLDTDPLIRNELANLLIHQKVAGYNNQRAMDKIKAGQLPGPEMSIAKLAGTLNSLRLCDFVSKVLGPKLIADNGEWGTYAWARSSWARPVAASPGAATRSCATSSASACWVFPRTWASTASRPSKTSRSAPRRTDRQYRQRPRHPSASRPPECVGSVRVARAHLSGR